MGGDAEDRGPELTARSAPLGPTARRVWMWHRLTPGSSAYNVVRAVQVDGDLDAAALRRAMGELGARHEALRSHVTEPRPGEPVVVVGDVAVELTVDTLGSPGAGRDAVDAALRAVARRPFDLERGPLWRVGIVRDADGARTWLVLALHHVISDLRSTDVVLRELADAYSASAAGEPWRPVGAAPSFLDHLAHDRAVVATGRAARDLDWWAAHLRDVGASPPVAFVPDAVPARAHEGVVRTLALTREESMALDVAARTSRTTPATLVLTAAAAVLHAWAGSPGEQVVGIPSVRHGRSSDAALVAFLLDTFALRVPMPRGASFADLCLAVRDAFLDAAEHARPPYDDVLRRLDAAAGGAPARLIRLWFTDLSTAACPARFGPGQAREWDLPPFGALFDVNLSLGRLEDGRLRLHLVTPPPGMAAADADALLEQLRTVLTSGCARPASPVRLPPGPGAPAVLDGPRRAAPEDAVRRWRDEDPGAPALVDQHGSLDYGRLDDAIDELASTLGGVAGRRVVLPARRDRTFVVRLLACRRAGVHPVLVDADWPAERRRAAARAAGATASFPDDGDGGPVAVPVLGRERTEQEPPSDRACHVLFTSGTTREPLPVEVEATVVDRELDSLRGVIGLGRLDRFGFLGGAAHDVGLRDVLLAFAVGGVLCVPPPVAARDPAQVAGWLRKDRVTVVNTTPVLLGLALRLASQELPALRLAISAGAPLSVRTLGLIRTRAPFATVLNGYGCTETPQLVTAELVPAGADLPDGRVAIGSPLPGRRVQVLDVDGPVGVGVPGELHVAGPGIARRYLGATRPDRFRTDPDGVRWFRTGDVARWDGSGRLHLAGRTDRQVLVNGFRVLLDEVEAAARALPGVAEATAALVSAGSDADAGQALELWVQPAPGAHLTEHDVRAAMGEWLAPPARPRVHLVESLPTSSNHKVLPPAARPAAVPVPASQAIELVLRVAERVGGRRLDPDVTFFAAGLTSVMLLQLIAELEQELRQPVSVVLPFEHPTPRALADRLGRGVVDQIGRTGDGRPAGDTADAQRRQARRGVRAALRRGEAVRVAGGPAGHPAVEENS
ncbi:AMP-binding protein [uncultured Cellulomonas sp.]|uniref:AMP-binding protein n=1 Tax=uncultured Cellulomonas sp. TaxID=189682 RepID=UPI0028E1F2EB|nr:AMP-binding protein [uncultured Cellulomonas sp.]